jgi:hypothetical protein
MLRSTLFFLSTFIKAYEKRHSLKTILSYHHIKYYFYPMARAIDENKELQIYKATHSIILKDGFAGKILQL